MSVSSFLKFSRGPHTAIALCLLVLCLVPLLLFVDQIALLKYLYPLSVFVIGLWLYAKTPLMYVSFTFWIWFLTPFVRRLVDYEVGFFDPINPIMLGPLIATSLAGLSLFRFGNLLKTRKYFPFLLLLAGIFYGYLVGAVRAGFLSASYDVLTWILPVLFGFHIAVMWRQFPGLKSTLRSTFAWGLLLLGSYGVLQFFLGPPWDMMWLQDSKMWLTMGPPEPMQFRVFSTLNSTGPFAFVMCALLLVLIDGRGLLTKFALVPGYLAFLLSLVRSAWAGWVVGVVFLVIWRLKGRLRKRLMGVLVVIALLGVPFFALSPLSQDISQRAQTFTNLDEDTSYRARLGIYVRGAKKALTSPVGSGLGSFGVSAKLSQDDVVSFDSGVFDILFSLGWLGTFCYVTGIVLLLRRTAFSSERDFDSFEPFLHGVSIAFVFMVLSLNQFTGLMGMMFWGTLGLALAARLHAEETTDDETPEVTKPPSRAPARPSKVSA